MMMANTACPERGALVGFIARAAFALAAGGLLLLASACGVERRVEPAVLPAPLVTRIPLKVGVHYTLEFRMARPISGTTVWKIGASSVALFNTALRGLFDEVVEVDRWPPTARMPTVAAVVIPTVLSAGGQMGQSNVWYLIELFSPRGDRLAGWEIAGHALGEPSVLGTNDAELMRQAIRAAGANLIVSFYREPQARAWLEANGVNPDALK